MVGFEYADQPHARRHGPTGYRNYESYREWLRDDFVFRCVYCLHREQWYNRSATFHVEHYVPSAVQPEAKCEYSNLLYACAACNEAKKAILDVPNPCEIAFHDCLRINADGTAQSLNHDGERLVQILRLNSPKNVEFRSRWMRVLEALRTNAPTLYDELMAYPPDLPDLRKKRVPGNTKPASVESCYFVLRQMGRLPKTY